MILVIVKIYRTFLSWGSQHVEKFFDGFGMLIQQAAASLELWTGVAPATKNNQIGPTRVGFIRFIAGAVCPSCKAQDKIAITPDDKTIYCLNCDFGKSLKILKINLQTLMSQKFLISMILDLKT